MPETRHDAVVNRCRDVIRRGSKSFAAAACLFDSPTRAAAYQLYAWCRHCDDEIDGEHLGYRDPAHERGDRRQRLAALYEKTHAAFAGEPQDDPVFAALHRVVTRYGIPERFPLELLEGFGMDVDGYRYERPEDLFLYCYHVAGTVGVMMAHVMGVRDDCTLKRAADLGIALQMTNIARDVLDDARAGRIYLPAVWLEEAGVPGAEILEMRHRKALAGVTRRLLAEADRYYESGAQGLARLPFRSAWAVAVARGVYREIGEMVLKRGEQAWDRRAIVPRLRKLAHVVHGFVTACKTSSVGRYQADAKRPDLWSKEPSLD